MSADATQPALVLLAKRPRPGGSKTRLAPALGRGRAAEVAAELIRCTAGLAAAAWPGPVRLLAWPDLSHPVFDGLSGRGRIELGLQAPGCLGTKMREALWDFTARGIPAAVMGCDVPQCPPEVLRGAWDGLSEGRNVVGPSVDGGYYLIGLQCCRAELFSDMRWGGPDVLESTLSRAAGLGIVLDQLPMLRDIDDYADLVAASEQLPVLRDWVL